jgi:prepilin-type N-terminal cleavage/methylation domain-containing protein
MFIIISKYWPYNVLFLFGFFSSFWYIICSFSWPNINELLLLGGETTRKREGSQPVIRIFNQFEKEKNMKNNKGFTLIELMIVVAIIAIIAAIAIPNLLRARLASNEASAIGSLRTLASAQSSLQSSGLVDDYPAGGNGTGEYGAFTDLSSAVPPFIDEVLGSGTKSGYLFTVTINAGAADSESVWWATAWPITLDTTGHRAFYVDESGVVRGSDLGVAAAAHLTTNNYDVWHPIGG